jgi:large subunit ribosomal protein L20
MLQAAKGFRLKRSKLYRYASDAVDHGRQYAYRDRRVKKRTFRYLSSAHQRRGPQAGITYSRLIEGLKAPSANSIAVISTSQRRMRSRSPKS